MCIQWIALYFLDENGPKRRYNIPVLSGTAYVGQLYDAKTDQLIPDQFLWKRSDMTILEKGITNVFFETKIEESQMDRMNVMDIDAKMKLSFMGGMVEVYIFKNSTISYKCHLIIFIYKIGIRICKIFERWEVFWWLGKNDIYLQEKG